MPAEARGFRSLEAAAVSGWQASSEEQQVLLIAEPSLQSPPYSFLLEVAEHCFLKVTIYPSIGLAVTLPLAH